MNRKKPHVKVLKIIFTSVHMGWIFTSMCREGVGGFKEVQQGNIILGGGGGSVTFSDLNQDFKTEKILQDIYLSTTDVGKL